MKKKNLLRRMGTYLEDFRLSTTIGANPSTTLEIVRPKGSKSEAQRADRGGVKLGKDVPLPTS